VAARREAELLGDCADFVLVVPSNCSVPDSALAAFTKVLRLPMPQIRKSPASLLAFAPRLVASSFRIRRELRQHNCKRVQINDFYLMHGAVLRLLGFRGRIVTWVRFDPQRYGGLSRILLAAARRSSDAIVAVSRFIQSRLPAGLQTTLVYESRSPEPVRPASTETQRRLLYVANYIRGKGQDDAIGAFERVAERFSDARLCFVGGDMGLEKNRAYRTELEQRAKRGPASGQIEFGGPLDDLGPVYRGAYAALNFSASESFSLTCQDASAFGLPLIATRSGGPQEIIDDEVTGFLVPVGDVDAMADRLERLLSDPALAANMGQRARELIGQRFRPDVFIGLVKGLLDLD
jgi:glycosyltransferase involved in cell wall biosynthesis